MRIKPTTVAGKWSTGLIIAFFVFILVFWIMVSLGVRGGEQFVLLDSLAIPMALAGVCAVLALVTSLIAIIRDKERAISVFMASAIGLYWVCLVVGEFLFRH